MRLQRREIGNRVYPGNRLDQPVMFMDFETCRCCSAHSSDSSGLLGEKLVLRVVLFEHAVRERKSYSQFRSASWSFSSNQRATQLR